MHSRIYAHMCTPYGSSGLIFAPSQTYSRRQTLNKAVVLDAKALAGPVAGRDLDSSPRHPGKRIEVGTLSFYRQ